MLFCCNPSTMMRPFSKSTPPFVLLCLSLLFHLICNNSKGYVLALASRYRGAGYPSPDKNNPIQLCVVLDNDKEDPEQAICFNSEIRGGGGEEMVETTTAPPHPTMSQPTTTEALLENPTFKALVETLQSIRFWNDALQEFRQRLSLRYLMKAVGLRRNEMEEAPGDVEWFADDDEMTQIMQVRKLWPLPDGKIKGGIIGVIFVRASTLFEQHENSCALHASAGPFAGKWVNGDRTWGWGWGMSPSLELVALTSSPDSNGRQSRFSPSASIAMSAAETLQRQDVILRFLQRGVLSTGHLPRYDSNCNGYQARVRDYNEMNLFDMSGSPYWEYTCIAPVSSFFMGSVELVIPTKSILQGSFVKLFGDVSFTHRVRRRADEEEEKASPFDNNIFRKSCIGAGIYKVPFRFGVSYSENGKAGISFGLTDGSGSSGYMID